MPTLSLWIFGPMLVATAANAAPVKQTAPTAVAPVPIVASIKAASAAAATLEKPVCKLIPLSYSHLSQRVCLTKEQWELVEQEIGN
jgi:hypothetical protein